MKAVRAGQSKVKLLAVLASRTGRPATQVVRSRHRFCPGSLQLPEPGPRTAHLDCSESRRA